MEQLSRRSLTVKYKNKTYKLMRIVNFPKRFQMWKFEDIEYLPDLIKQYKYKPTEELAYSLIFLDGYLELIFNNTTRRFEELGISVPNRMKKEVTREHHAAKDDVMNGGSGFEAEPLPLELNWPDLTQLKDKFTVLLEYSQLPKRERFNKKHEKPNSK